MFHGGRDFARISRHVLSHFVLYYGHVSYRCGYFRLATRGHLIDNDVKNNIYPLIYFTNAAEIIQHCAIDIARFLIERAISRVINMVFRSKVSKIEFLHSIVNFVSIFNKLDERKRNNE